MKTIISNISTIPFLILILAFSPQAAATNCKTTKAAAWYTTSAQDINDLENIGFNLFFHASPQYDGMTQSQRNSFISQAISALDECSQIIFSIEPFLTKGWFHADGLENFMAQWGNHPKIYGFLLKDDVLTARHPSSGSVDPNALWIYRWFYRMIRNTAEDRENSYGMDLAPGKKIIVTIPFRYQDDAGNEVSNRITGGHFHIRSEYNFPQNFLTPGDSWDIVMPYWYPHRRQISSVNEKYIMDILYSEMSGLFPAASMIPIIQVVSEPESTRYFTLESEFDLSIQYERFISNGILSASNRTIFYYTANGHAGVCNNLLHKNCQRDATTGNPYYREAGILNQYHFWHYPN